jgi:hypothetical protein
MRLETFYDRMERGKKEFLQYHQNLKLSIDHLFKNEDGTVKDNFDFEPI